MIYELPDDLRKRIEARLADGEYHSQDDVLRSALDALDQVEQDKLTRWKERNCLAMKQSSRGESKPLDDAKVLQRLRERLAKEGVFD